MPAGKVAKLKSIEDWPSTSVTIPQGAGRSISITLDRELFLERGDVIGHVDAAPPYSAASVRGYSGCTMPR